MSLLKHLIEERFRFSLNLKKEDLIQEVWNEYFEIAEFNQDPFEIIKKLIVARPRDLIYMFTKIFESAVNNDHIKINSEDFDYAIEAYSLFLRKNLVAELKAEFPEIEEIFLKIQYDAVNYVIEYSKFINLLKLLNYNDEKINKLLESLFDKNYIIALDQKEKIPITNFEVFKAKIQKRRFKLFNRSKALLIPNPQEYYLKNWRIQINNN
ncbi:MAG: hypothetical protein DWQ05_06300 [Calditrichaeota bacterium]|nr:MAG: hypothetical protein DWQ05_06300 [Calditrichota bacterium]